MIAYTFVMGSSLAQRFEAKVKATDGCWEWQGSKGPGGYGVITADGKQLQTHRVAYELHVGPIPEGLVIDHLCSNRVCVRPDHLEPVTPSENARRQHSRKRTMYAPTTTRMSNLIETRVAANVLLARKNAGLSQRRLADLLETGTLTISRWENAHVLPSTTNLIALADQLGLDPGWFYQAHEAAEAAAVAA
jgi:ribosome-binding protein aMBF1 (putative translation factor)